MDVDNDPAEAAAVLGNIQTVEGDAPIRARANSSKAMLFYRLIDGEARIRKRQLRWRTAAGREHLLELSGEGHQVIAEGVHPSGARYEYPKGRKPLAELPQTTTELREAMLASVKAGIMARGGVVLSDTGTAASHVDPASVPQESLRAPSAERFAALVADLPNPEEVGREMWVDVLRAMRATAADLLDDAGEEAARQWSALHPSHDDSRFDAAWRSVAGPSSLGWEMLVNKGKQWGSSVATDETCLLDFADVPLPTPANDTGTAAPAPRRRFVPLSMADCAAAPARPYIIKGVLAAGDLGILFGLPGCGKSALAPYLCHAVATGRDVFGRRTRPRVVLYVAAEDGHGMRGRFTALRTVHGDAPGMLLLNETVNLGSADDMAALLACIAECGAGLVVVDTLAASFPGLKENESEDMGRAVAALRTLSKPTGAAVLLIHHGTKSGEGGPRGHSLLNGAADITLEIERANPRDAARSVVFGKNRNGPAVGLSWHFIVKGEPIGLDADGDMETAALAVEDSGGRKMAKPLPPTPAAVLAALDALVAQEGAALPDQPDFPRGLSGVTEGRWREECEQRRISGATKASDRERVFRDSRSTLRERGLVELRGGYAWRIPGTG